MLDRRGETSETSDEKMVEIYENHLWRANYLMRHASHLETFDLHYKKVLADPAGEASISFPVPPIATGVTVNMQAAAEKLVGTLLSNSLYQVIQ